MLGRLEVGCEREDGEEDERTEGKEEAIISQTLAVGGAGLLEIRVGGEVATVPVMRA